jgi:transcriptional regulator with XRE-family HTH domain
MAIGQRIKYFRTRKGLTQKQLGEKLGFLGKTSDVRMAQYESEARVPKRNLVEEMADILEVSPNALTVPDIDTYQGFLHTLFALEDMYGLHIFRSEDGAFCLRFDKETVTPSSPLEPMLSAWLRQTEKENSGEISREEYDEWRYTYPAMETYQHKRNQRKKNNAEH